MGDGSEVLDDLFGVFGLASAGLARDQDALILVFVHHVAVCLVGHGEDVRLVVLSVTTPVYVNVLVGVDRERRVGVNGDEEEPGVGVDEVGHVSRVEVMDDRSLVEVRQLGHVVGLVEFGGVHLVDRLGVDLPLL
jgi:hypothetical protein